MHRFHFFSLCFFFSLVSLPLHAQNDSSEKGETNQQPVGISNSSLGSYPGGPAEKFPLSTGYYLIDNRIPASVPAWEYVGEQFLTTLDSTVTSVNAGFRIRSGPNQDGVNQYGRNYFYNPDDPDDSTDDAFAGPIAIPFPFYYYGVRYDSFYVSTNGLIALSNRRYEYGPAGERIGYNSQSIDPRPRLGDAATDTVPDDYGFQFIARGNASHPLGGIRLWNNTDYIERGYVFGPVLAPMWEDLELLRSTPEKPKPGEQGNVYWRWMKEEDRLKITVVGTSMKTDRWVNLPTGDIDRSIPADSLRVSFAVLLDGADSSITFIYENFSGSVNTASWPVKSREVSAASIFQTNGAIGIRSIDYEHTDYLYRYPNSRDRQPGTVYVGGDLAGPLRSGLAVTFKQWKNVGRILSMGYQRLNPNDTSRFDTAIRSNNVEMYLGDPTLRTVRPVGIVENLSSDRGQVNKTPQPVTFQTTFRIVDAVNRMAPPVYQQSLISRPLYPTEIAPGVLNTNAAEPNIDTIFFTPYMPNPAVRANVGRFHSEMTLRPEDEALVDEWPFDDTLSGRLFAMRRVEMPLSSTFSDYSTAVAVDGEVTAIPDIYSYVSIGATVVDGEKETWNPPAPQGVAGTLALNSPVLKLDRRDADGNFYNNNLPGALAGDTLISFPINLRPVLYDAQIILSYQRGGRHHYDRGWSDSLRIGPESGVYNNAKTGFFQVPDNLILEFAEPGSENNATDNVVNPLRWGQVGFLDSTGSLPATTYWGIMATPRWGIFGGGGGADTGGNIVVDVLDAGKDFSFKKAWIPIPERFWKDTLAAKNFRFRLRVLAKNDGNQFGLPQDDDDAFYIDNIWVTDLDHPEIELAGVEVDWPYTEAPASQAQSIPLRASVYNNDISTTGPIGVSMFIENLDNPLPEGEYNYHRTKTVISAKQGTYTPIEFPTWNAQECGANIDGATATEGTTTHYRVTARLYPSGFDYVNSNDEISTEFDLRLGGTIAYDYIDEKGESHNDVPDFAGVEGRGLTLSLVYPKYTNDISFGPIQHPNPGAFAAGFQLTERDTIRGFQAWYGSANSAPDNVIYALYKQPVDSGIGSKPVLLKSDPELGLIPATRFSAHRGEGLRATDMVPVSNYFDGYLIYELPTPYVAEPGYYFVTVGHDQRINIELGASAYRQGQQMTLYSAEGGDKANVNLTLHPEMKAPRFWYESGSERDEWYPLLIEKAIPGYPHQTVAGVDANGFSTYQQGSWIPMIRPWFGFKSSMACNADTVTTSVATPGVSAGDRSKGRDLLLLAPRPNPASRIVTIPFLTSRDRKITLEICDSYGSVVRTFRMDGIAERENSVDWDLRDGTGTTVPNGIYLCKVTGDGTIRSQRIVVLR